MGEPDKICIHTRTWDIAVQKPCRVMGRSVWEASISDEAWSDWPRVSGLSKCRMGGFLHGRLDTGRVRSTSTQLGSSCSLRTYGHNVVGGTATWRSSGSSEDRWLHGVVS